MRTRTWQGWIRALPIVAVLVAGQLAGAVSGSAAIETPDRLVAVGDVHGEYDGLVSILQEAALIDDQNQWIGGETTLVQTGDLVDRGPRVRQVLDLMMDLQKQAAAAGGRVIVLMGNHESLNLIGDFQDATAEILASFAGPDAEEVREREWNEWVDWIEKLARSRGGEAPALDDAKKEQWMSEHPPGYFEYMRAMSPESRYGGWLINLPVVAKIGDTIFMHAGISPEWSTYSLDEINELHRSEFTTFAEDRAKLSKRGIVPWYFNVYEINKSLTYEIENPPLPKYSNASQMRVIVSAADDLNRMEKILVQDSPLWYRGYTNLDEDDLVASLDQLERIYGAHRFIVAHTPLVTATIMDRADGRVFLIDTGMLASYYGGRPSALEIEDGRYSALYNDGERQVLLETDGDPIPASASVSGAAVAPGPRLAPAVLATSRGRDIRLASYSPQESGGGGSILPPRVWRDPLGNPLPFKTHEEMENFLATATVVSQQNIPKGVTKPKKVLLEKDGVQAHAKFNYVDRSGQREKMADGTVEMWFLDSYKADLAAYRLSLLMGMDNIPPGVARNIDGQDGIVQLWVEGLNTYENWLKKEGNTGTPASTYFDRQLKDMYAFDLLIRNTDRNQGNIAWDEDNNLWLIDNTRSLAQDAKLRDPAKFKGCSRKLYNAMKALDEAEVSAALSPYLGNFEIKALMKRRDALIKLIDKQIAKEGESEVLFNYEDPPPGLTISYD